MFLADTNVISELRRPERANPNLLAWAAAVPITSLHLSVITVMELEVGTLQMERRDAAQGAVLRQWLDKEVRPRFGGRIVMVDEPIALCCARLHVPDRRPERDALIAATAIIHGFTVVTRNVADFAAMGVEFINPWTPAAP
jgi:predicted nucleic acid-binding protein